MSAESPRPVYACIYTGYYALISNPNYPDDWPAACWFKIQSRECLSSAPLPFSALRGKLLTEALWSHLATLGQLLLSPGFVTLDERYLLLLQWRHINTMTHQITALSVLCVWNVPLSGGVPSQMASDEESIPVPWRHPFYSSDYYRYSIAQETCTRFCCALLCCGYAIVHNEFKWSIYPYSSGLLCWQWSKPDGYGKISQCITTTKRSKAKTVCIFLGIYCTSRCNQTVWLTNSRSTWVIRTTIHTPSHIVSCKCHFQSTWYDKSSHAATGVQVMNTWPRSNI